ncbi:EAL domain-containing protein [Cupriavidus necator]
MQPYLIMRALTGCAMTEPPWPPLSDKPWQRSRDLRRSAMQADIIDAAPQQHALPSPRNGTGFWVLSVESGQLSWDEGICLMHGLDPAAASTEVESWLRLIHPDDSPRMRKALRLAITRQQPFDIMYRVPFPDGSERHIRALSKLISETRYSAYVVGMHLDITDQQSIIASLFEEKERLQTTLRSIGDGVICTDASSHITFMNAVAEQLTGWGIANAIGRPIRDIFCIVDEYTNEEIPSPVDECLRTMELVHLREGARLRSRSGAYHDVQDTAAPVKTLGGEVIGAVLIFQDISRARALQRELKYAATHDALTELPNRSWFERQVRLVAKSMVNSQRQHVLCYIDLDRFKVVNDTAGHTAGDKLLREVAGLLRQHIRECDLLARIGGDEFALLLLDCDLPHAESICEELIDTIRTHRFHWEGKVYDIGASIGIVSLEHGGHLLSRQMSEADVACYAAKSAGRNRVASYADSHSDARRHHIELQMAAGVRSALEQNRFQLYAQEIMPLSEDSGRKRAEILLRMQGEAGELIAPGAFIIAAERYGLMSDVDQWVINHLFEHYSDRLRELGDLELSINLSANSLGNRDVFNSLKCRLHAANIPASQIHLEITETAVINNIASAVEYLKEMQAIGCTITLDDFGTGLASFLYLKKFPATCLKIDGIFTRKLSRNTIDYEIIKSINHVSHTMNIETVAEAVEDEQTLQILREIGVDFVQGRAISEPVLLDSFLSALLSQRQAIDAWSQATTS